MRCTVAAYSMLSGAWSLEHLLQTLVLSLPAEHRGRTTAQVIGGLNEKRLLVEKELNSLGKAPRGVKDIFHQCRNFERAYAVALEVSSQHWGSMLSSKGPILPKSPMSDNRQD